MEDIREIVSKNLTTIRKQNNLTQADLSKKINFSDNAISRWEKGEVLPSLETLQMLSLIYNVPLNWFIQEHSDEQTIIYNNKKRNLYIAMTSAIVLAIWVVALIIFLITSKNTENPSAMPFIWAIPATAFAIRYTLKYFFKDRFYLLSSSLCVWLTIGCFYVQWLQYNIWPIFFLGIPIQLIFILVDSVRKLRVDKINVSKKSKKE